MQRAHNAPALRRGGHLASRPPHLSEKRRLLFTRTFMGTPSFRQTAGLRFASLHDDRCVCLCNADFSIKRNFRHLAYVSPLPWKSEYGGRNPRGMFWKKEIHETLPVISNGHPPQTPAFEKREYGRGSRRPYTHTRLHAASSLPRIRSRLGRRPTREARLLLC